MSGEARAGSDHWNRHCERSEAIHPHRATASGLLRCARNGAMGRLIPRPLQRTATRHEAVVGAPPAALRQRAALASHSRAIALPPSCRNHTFSARVQGLNFGF